jgi:molybdopterin synthase catalytic subunit
VTLFAVRKSPITVDEALLAVSSPECGGLAVFVGTVRNHEQGLPVTLLEYHAYESMAEKQLRRIGEQIQAELPGVRVAALHRVGALNVGEAAVICVAAAPHREEAFQACRLLIDRIKEEVPVWKREHGPDGPYWVGWQDARCKGHEHHGAHQHRLEK